MIIFISLVVGIATWLYFTFRACEDAGKTVSSERAFLGVLAMPLGIVVFGIMYVLLITLKSILNM